MATLTFYGAAQEVTGSCHLLETRAYGRILLDCGMHQGGKATDRIEREDFAFDPRSIDAVILSHAHLDHSGLLPRLIHEGFSGPIYCTQASAELLVIMLNDAANLYERDLEKDNERRARRGEPAKLPAYSKKDVEKVLRKCETFSYNTDVSLSEALRLKFYDAGHILGSSIIELKISENETEKTLVFSGDLGNKDAVLMNDPAILKQADVVLMEGTYGDRNHRTIDDTVEQFRDILHDTWQSGGNVMIPAFAVGRTQELLFYLGKLHAAGELDNWQVILDSPMAISVTQIYDRWLRSLDCEGIKQLCSGDQTLLRDFLPHLNLTVSPEESMAINRIKTGLIIIAGSGMCTGGRIRHHFKQRIWNKHNTVIFAGYQARGTLGRTLVDGATKIKLFREPFVVKARVETLGGFSAHAGQQELLDWAGNFENQARFVLVHGDPEALDALADKLWKDKGIRAKIPFFGESIAF